MTSEGTEQFEPNVLEDEAPQVPETQAKITVHLIRDNHEAEMMLQRTGSNTVDPTIEQLRAALEEKGVTTGIKEDVLDVLSRSPTYNENIIVAVGRRPAVGEAGRLEYKIRTSKTLRPTINPDGTADYKDLGYINSVEQGQALVEIIPPTKGEDGIDVLGNVLEGIMGKAAPSPKGAGTEFNEDNTQLIALVPGNAEVKKGIVSIQEILKIKGNIDNSTGDINFVGDVMINGDIASGFRVVSGANITVKGTVEGAHLDAKGDIVISEGMNGMNRGTITAGGNIKIRYAQNCYIQAGGDVYADTIMYSTLECNGNVEFSGKRSQLIGGQSSIAGKLTAKIIGAEANTATQINMCTSSITKRRESEELDLQLKKIDGEIAKLIQVLNRFDDLQKKGRLEEEHVKTVMQVKEQYVDLTNRRKETVSKQEELAEERLNNAQDSYIECKGRVHAGVRLSFGPLSYVVQDSFVYSRISIIDGEITISPL